MRVTVRPAAIFRVELVVDSTGACDLIVMHVRPTAFPPGLSALESGNAAQERRLVRAVGEVVPELLHLLVTGLTSRVLPSLTTGFSTSGFGNAAWWMVSRPGWRS